MGYTTEFTGRFELDHELTNELYEYLKTFATVRHMKRNNEKIKELFPDWQKYCLCMGLGLDGEYFVRDDGDFGQSHDDSIMNYNMPAESQPGLWCQWIPTSDKKHIEWDGGEKFYNYIEWLYYIIGNFLEPNNYLLNGEVTWQGESFNDHGTIIVTNNEITINVNPNTTVSNKILAYNKCPNCGSNMDFDIDSHIFICAYCGTKALISNRQRMTYGDLMLMFLGEKPIPKDLDPRIKKLTILNCLDHHPDDVIIFDDEEDEKNVN